MRKEVGFGDELRARTPFVGIYPAFTAVRPYPPVFEAVVRAS